jgi:small subunit ribosomal protein S1
MADGTQEPDSTARDSRPVDLDAKLEQEIEDALGDMSVEDMLDLGDPAQSSAPGDQARMGTVVSVRGKEVMVEFGPKTQGLCALDQFDAPPQPGERMEFSVQRFDQNEGLLILSRKGAVQKADWDSLDVGQIVEARCVGVVKGGLEMSVANHKAFMPASQVDLHFIKDISVYLNEKMACEVMRIERNRGRIVLSRRNVLEVERAKRREELMDTIAVGRKVPAVITSVQPYGAFADIGGVDGLIHVSDLSYQRVNHANEVVKEGDTVEVEILKIEPDSPKGGPRIALGLKQCQSDPFETKLAELTEGEDVSGKVTRIMPFGAFIELSPGVEGLVHISQLAHERVSKVEHIVKVGEIVNARVMSIDPSSRRISLSLKALKDSPAAMEADLSRGEDPHMRKLKAQLSKRFGDNLKGGIG